MSFKHYGILPYSSIMTMLCSLAINLLPMLVDSFRISFQIQNSGVYLKLFGKEDVSIQKFLSAVSLKNGFFCTHLNYCIAAHLCCHTMISKKFIQVHCDHELPQLVLYSFTQWFYVVACILVAVLVALFYYFIHSK